MKRTLFTFGAGFMLLLWMLAGTLWILSYVAPGDAHYFWPKEREADSAFNSGFSTAAVSSMVYSKGRIGIGGFMFGSSGSPSLARLEGEFLLPDPGAKDATRWNRLGFSYRSDGGYNWGIGFPIWVILVLATPLPVFWLRWYTRRRKFKSRRGEGLCLACGYDLRGSEVRCPECGKPFRSRGRPEAAWISLAFGLSKDNRMGSVGAKVNHPADRAKKSNGRI